MKKLLVLALAASMTLGLAACGSSSSDKAADTAPAETTESADAAESTGSDKTWVIAMDTVFRPFEYTDENGETKNPIMGCYGIGVGRLAASVCEAKHDEYGPIWPISIAPWEVEVCCLRVDDEQTKEVADKLYKDLQSASVETLYDDRDVRPGAMFSDADLLGAPIRVVVSPRNLKESCVEVTTRDKSVKEMIPVDEAFEYIKGLKEKMFADINAKVEPYK